MANFPLVTWQVDVPAFTVSRGASTHTSSPATLWGFAITTGAGAAAATSLAGFLAAEITASGLATASAQYVYSNTPGPALSPMLYNMTVTAASGVNVSFGSVAAAARFGLLSIGGVVPFPASPSGTVTSSTLNVDGLWMPNGVAGDVRRFTQQRAAVSSSDMSGATTDVVNWGEVADLEFLASAFPAGNLSKWFAGIPIYAAAAGRDDADPNNTLEGLLAAAAAGRTFRIYREAATASGTSSNYYQVAKMPIIGRASTVRDYATPVDEPRLWDSAGLFFRAS